jgi:hypothetical protein
LIREVASYARPNLITRGSCEEPERPELGCGTRPHRWAVSSVAILVIIIVLMAAVASGYYFLTSGQSPITQTSASSSTFSTPSTSRSGSIGPLSSSLTSTSVQLTSVTTSSVASTSTPTGSKSFFGAIYLNIQSSNEPKDLFGNYSQMSFHLQARSLNSSAVATLDTSYSIVGYPLVEGISTTEVNFTSVAIVSDPGVFGGFGLFRSATSHSSVWLAQNRSVIQVDVNGTEFTSGDMLTPFQEAAGGILLIGAYALATPLLFEAAGNSTVARVANASSVVIGSTRLLVTTVVSTPVYPTKTVIGLGTALGTSLYVPTFVSFTAEANPGDTGSWVALTDTLVSVSIA